MKVVTIYSDKLEQSYYDGLALGGTTLRPGVAEVITEVQHELLKKIQPSWKKRFNVTVEVTDAKKGGEGTTAKKDEGEPGGSTPPTPNPSGTASSRSK